MTCAQRLLAIAFLSGCATAPHRAVAPPTEAPTSDEAEGGSPADADAAAEALAALVTAPAPPPRAFARLKALVRHLSAAERQRIAQLGSSPERPVHVGAQYEYSWVGLFACVEGHPRVTRQALLKGSQGDLDALEFDCGEGPTRALYFDSSGH